MCCHGVERRSQVKVSTLAPDRQVAGVLLATAGDRTYDREVGVQSRILDWEA